MERSAEQMRVLPGMGRGIRNVGGSHESATNASIALFGVQLVKATTDRRVGTHIAYPVSLPRVVRGVARPEETDTIVVVYLVRVVGSGGAAFRCAPAVSVSGSFAGLRRMARARASTG